MKKEEFITKYLAQAKDNLEYILSSKDEMEEDEFIKYISDFISNDNEE